MKRLKTKSKYSTSEETSSFKGEHYIIDLILEYRGHKKHYLLINVPLLIDLQSGKIHNI